MTARSGGWFFGLVLLTAGCGGNCGGKVEPQASDKPAAEQPAASSVPQIAVVEGVVRLANGYELPSYRPEQMERKVLQHTERAPLPETCAPPKTTDRQPVKLASDGASLTGVLIAASEFTRQPTRPPMVHEVIIEDCRLEPSVIAAMKGDTLRVRSALDYPFMPAYGETPVVRTLIRGQTYDVTLDTPGVQPLLCGFTAPCGRTDVVTMLHPLAAVTDDAGKFRIEGFPAGEQVRLSAWHPLFKETRIDLKVEPGETKKLELVLTPNVPLSPAPPQTPGAPSPPAAGPEKAPGKPAAP